MPSIRPPRIIRPSVLSRLKPASLVALLHPYEAYFASRGAGLAGLAQDPAALEAVIAVLALPIEQTPTALVEQMELLDLLSDRQSGVAFEDCYEALVSDLREDDDSEEDLAVKILLHAPEIAWREFDRQALRAKRSLVSFSHNPALPFQAPTTERIERLERFLAPWFEQNARSGICRVHVRQEPHGTALVIRHGDLLKRIGIFDENGCSASRILRPERVDVAHYRLETREWQVSGIGRRLQELYRQALGHIFHASAGALVHSKRYSLEPLREGPSILRCGPGGTVQYAHLASLKLELPGGTRMELIRGDIFESLEQTNPTLLACAGLLEARIDLKLSGRRRLLPIVLNPGHDRISGPQHHPAIEGWLAERGFSHPEDEGLLLESA